jgi:tRNA (Thr-GGU) A37 N-methylase
MPSPNSLALQQLDLLNRSSPDFPDQFCNIIYGEEYVQCVRNLEGDDLVWLVEYLDKVRRRVALLHSPLKPA